MNYAVTFPTAPNVEISKNGDIILTEVVREGVRKLEAYAEEMSSTNAVDALMNVDKVHASVLKLWNVVQSQPGITEEQVSRIKDLYDSAINSLNTKGPETKLMAAPRPRTRRASSQFLRPRVPGGASISNARSERAGSTATTLQEFTSTSSTRLQPRVPRLRTRTLYSMVSERAQLVSKFSRVSCLEVPMLLSPLPAIAAQPSSTTRPSSNATAAKDPLSL